MEVELPYKAEYAKSGRASCKSCKSNIGQGTLRLAIMVQSAFHDGKQPNWFHESCFFKKQRPGSVGDISNYENLHYEDQERIEKKIVAASNSNDNNKKRSKASEKTASKDFGVEYAKSSRSACRGCELKIMKDQIRIRKTVYDTEVGMKYGGQPLWHHMECFSQLRSDLGWLESGEQLPGFSSLKEEDQVSLKKLLAPVKSENGEPNAKKLKVEKLDKKEEEEEKQKKELMKKQNKELFKFRNNVENELNKNEIIELLQHNNQKPIEGDSGKLLDQVADMMTFGALEPCSICKTSQMLFNKSGYLCNGQLTEWTKCANLIKEPQRSACIVPNDLKKKYPFLKKIGKKTETRIFRYVPPSELTISKNVILKKEDELDGPKIKRERPPLYNLQFSQIGLKNEENIIKTRIAKLGGKFEKKINQNTIAIFSTAKDIKSMAGRMVMAKEQGIHIIPIEYLDAVEKDGAGAVSMIVSMSLCDWGTDPHTRILKEETKDYKSKSIFTKSVPKSMKLKVKDGLAVDPDSGLEDVAHVYVSKGVKYNAVLGLFDLQKNKNSYYKLQLLKKDSSNRFWVFRSWGRIGTTIGGTKLEDFSSLDEALRVFQNLYFEKSGNHFSQHENFVKVPGRMYPIDIEYGDDFSQPKPGKDTVKSKLDPSVQDLIKLLFDVETMKRTMMEFDLDLEKMPLGKLSKNQIKSAYKVLTEIHQLIVKGGNNMSFIDATNRFYTLIPHCFGVQKPPLLDTTEQIEKHRLMLDSLLEIECAYSLLKTDEDTDDTVNPLDKYYEQLKTKLEPLSKDSEEFSLIKKYVKNTHAETHKMYELKIEDIFKVTRQGESRRFKPFKKLHNRKLLWHGSRVTNFAGILSHGLKIAPPEAPVTGYMFGKGIYFADMVSKSANYCCTSQQHPSGLMLLSEVALGDMLECYKANYIEKLPANKHSCFGRGSTQPNPKLSYFREDGVEIPLGIPEINSNMKSSLLYNEYIVYDIAQVNIQYLLRMNFKYNY